MSFVETVGRARQLLEKNRRLSLRALKREFALDGDALGELAEDWSTSSALRRAKGTCSPGSKRASGHPNR
ncbi:MAG: hypothetical protein ACREI8_05220, partial [Myxococcota bacterium]